MTEVLSIPTQAEGSAFFDTNPLRRSSSQTSLFLQNSPSYSRPSSTFKPKYPSSGFENRISASLPSSAPSSPCLTQFGPSAQPSYTSTPSSSLSLDDQCSTEDDDEDGEEQNIIFPDYEEGGVQQSPCLQPKLEKLSILPPLCTNSLPPSASTNSPTKPSHPEASYRSRSTEDDTAVKSEPTAHVDYLSHNWAEEDIWASWRYVVSKRKVYANGIRLENAVWRSWSKSKYQIKTIAPGQLNWEKDHDVTWLYGPLQTGAKFLNCVSPRRVSQMSRTNSFASKKPILKKRSLSEAMLQRSLTSFTLMRQATDALRAQQPGRSLRGRPVLGVRALSDFVTGSLPERPDLQPITSSPITLSSASTSGLHTPCTKRHIHFNDKVEQCIAINKGGYDRDDYFGATHDDSSSEDELLTMKPVWRAKPRLSNQSTPRSSFNGDSKTIAMLPSTTLNYRGDTPDPAEQKFKQRGSFWSAASKISPCPSQQTITPRMGAANFLLDDDDEEVDLDWQPTLYRRNSIYLHQQPVSTESSRDDLDQEHSAGLRRTPSGMFMPHEEEEKSFVSSGLVGKVVNTVNTAKDIVHVIWNVGWRR